MARNQRISSYFVLFSMGVSLLQPHLLIAPSHQPKEEPPPPPVIVHHDETGWVSFIGTNQDKPIAVPGSEKAGLRASERAKVILDTYGPWFGINNANQELSLISERAGGKNSKVFRYQQYYQGIPVLAGEIILNMTNQGRLVSMNGEISPELDLSVSPQITSGTAKFLALGKVGRTYNINQSVLKATEPELWIFDERLLLPSTRPAELVWRVEVRATNGAPINELVLINAERGGISLHFNQVDTHWFFGSSQEEQPTSTNTPTPTNMATNTPTPTATNTSISTPSDTSIPEASPTATFEPTATYTGNPTATPTTEPTTTTTVTTTATTTDEPTATSTETTTVEPTVSPTETQTQTPTLTETVVPLAPTPYAHPSILLDTFTANNSTSLPGTFLCNQTQPNCTNESDLHADAAHIYAWDTADYYYDQHNRDSLDNAGMKIVSSVHYDSGYNNAFWDGSQMVYGDGAGYPLADDVVGHELTHGVTDYTSNLFYYYQSGAINESFSDLWGEFVDLTNGAGNDSVGVRWLIGEDISGGSVLRSMSNPPDYLDPDAMTHPYYYTDNADLGVFGDNGGVHTNSGVNNKAVYLMVDGGFFNGITVSIIGIDKVAAIYYEAQTNLLTSGADYKDLYYALQQACTNLIGGVEGITLGDCGEVEDALDAVRMNQEPISGYNPEAPLCPSGYTVSDLFYDDFELGLGNWTINNGGSPSPVWVSANGYATSGTKMIYGIDYEGFDSNAALNTDIPIPPTGMTYLHFNHAFGFEDPDYDGGWLEYSTNSGSTWMDASGIFLDGLNYNGNINTVFGNGDNPHTGRNAFIGDSHGYVSSRYHLNTLAGQSVRFRWRMSTDSIFYDLGWVIDDVRIFNCLGPPFSFLPTNLTATTISNNEVDLNWDTNAVEGFKHKIEKSIDGNTWEEFRTTSYNTNYAIVVGLACDTLYYFRVRIYRIIDGQYSNYSNLASTTTSACPPSGDYISADGFESGDLTEWEDSYNGGGTMTVNNSAAMFGNYGLELGIINGSAVSIVDKDPSHETRYRARFYVDISNLSMNSGSSHHILLTRGGEYNFRLVLNWDGINYRVRGEVRNEANDWVFTTGWHNLINGQNYIEFDWSAASTSGATDGFFSLWVNGELKETILGIDNYGHWVDKISLGMVDMTSPSTNGEMYFDAFESRRITYIGLVPVSTWYLAEGFTGAGFGTFILVQNPNSEVAHVDVTYMLQGGGTLLRHIVISENSRYTIVAHDPGQVGPDQAFSTRLDADQPIIVERAMYWPNGADTSGGHVTTGITNPANTWYLAEGYSGAGFGTFILIQNPNAVDANITVTYMLQGGGTITKNVIVPGNSRFTIVAHDPGQVGPDQAFSTRLDADQPIIVERAMYFNNDGHDAGGVVSPQVTWYLAEGYSGAGFGTFILIQNPNVDDANVTVTYMLQGGGTIEKNVMVPGNSRFTIVAHDPGQVGLDQAFSTLLEADQPIIVERAMYWPNGGSGEVGGHDSSGVTSPANTWNLAEGYTGTGFGTYILIQNPNSTDANITITYMLQGGGTIVKNIIVPGNSRFTVVAQDPNQVGPDQAFSTQLVSDQPIIVERAMYFPNGGHGTTGVPQ